MSAEIFISVLLAFSTAVLAATGIYASVGEQKTKKQKLRIWICTGFFALLGMFLVFLQSSMASDQQARNEKAQKDLKESFDKGLEEMNAQQSLINSSPDFDLKKKAMLLSREMLQFTLEREAGEDRSDFFSNQTRETFNERVYKETAYSQQTKMKFIQKFSIRWESIIKELITRKINIGYLDQSGQSVATNRLSIQRSAIELGAIAVQIP